MSEPLFTVVIPLFNKGKYIETTVGCVLRQTVADFELLVVDDGSVDEGPAIVRRIRDPRLRVIRQENGGVSKARNRGIGEARGKYIAFLDADDEWTEDFLETCLDLFREFPEAKAVCPSYQMKYEKKTVVPRWRSVLPDRPCLVEDFFEMGTAPCWVMNSSCIAVEARALRSLDVLFPENERVWEDYDLWLRLGARYPVAHSPKVCAAYVRQTEGNARETNKIIYSQALMDTIGRLLEGDGLSPQQRQWLLEIRDRRMVPYIFSLLLAGEKRTAKDELGKWSPGGAYRKHRAALRLGRFLPRAVLRGIQAVRLRVF